MINFKPTSEMISAAKAVLISMAYTQTIREIVEQYQTNVLAELQLKSQHRQFGQRCDEGGVVILLDKDTYLLSETDAALYHRRCKLERDKSGLKVDNPQQCPLLVAESIEASAKRLLLEVVAPAINLDPTVLRSISLANHKKMVDLTLRLLTPFVDTKDVTF